MPPAKPSANYAAAMTPVCNVSSGIWSQPVLRLAVAVALPLVAVLLPRVRPRVLHPLARAPRLLAMLKGEAVDVDAVLAVVAPRRPKPRPFRQPRLPRQPHPLLRLRLQRKHLLRPKAKPPRRLDAEAAVASVAAELPLRARTAWS
jgi:hypothetical protein